MTNCNDYWQHADYLPLDLVITYWCEQSGFNAAHCRDAKKSAILASITSGQIKFKRSDGKPFQDDIYILAANHLLLIERDSFNAWAKQFADIQSIEKPLSTKEINTVLVIIAALCKDVGYDYTKASKTAGLIQSTAALMGVSIGETTIEGYLQKIPDALAARMK